MCLCPPKNVSVFVSRNAQPLGRYTPRCYFMIPDPARTSAIPVYASGSHTHTHTHRVHSSISSLHSLLRQFSVRNTHTHTHAHTHTHTHTAAIHLYAHIIFVQQILTYARARCLSLSRSSPNIPHRLFLSNHNWALTFENFSRVCRVHASSPNSHFC
jgi:hypothetical protein